MYFRLLLISIISIQFLVSCGGSESKADTGSNSSSQIKGKLKSDPDGLPKDKSVGQLALSSNEVENSVCFADIPNFRDLNDIYFNQSRQEPVNDIYFNYVLSENEYGATEVELSFLGQNQKTYDLLTALLFNVKTNPGQGRPPTLNVSQKKLIYNSIRGFCRDIQCAADSVFGDSWGLRFLFKEKFGVLLSGFVDENTEEFRDDQYLYSVAQAILSLPKGTFPLDKNNFVSSTRDFTPQNIIIAPYATGKIPTAGAENAAGITLSSRSGSQTSMQLANVDIYLLDPWKEQRGFHDRVYTVFHELIHVLDQAKENQLVLSQSKEWLKISDWRLNSSNNTWVMVKDKYKCSEYGSTLPQEDFAECGSLYRFAPNKLKKISKAKYDFFKKRVFKGIEYHTASKCQKNIETF
jgi:hypothetical protein